MNMEEEKMRVIMEYCAAHYPSPYVLEALPFNGRNAPCATMGECACYATVKSRSR